VVSELTPQLGDPVVTKHTTSPFNTTDIEVYLRRFGVNTLVPHGLLHHCGLTAGRQGQNYDCVVVRDCCAAAIAQEQDTYMDIVFPRMAWVASVDEVISAIKG
jgi:nicotinamidase-related amidase